METEHSIERHPLRDAEDFDELRRQVQYGEISWPVGADIRKGEASENETESE